MKGYKFMNKQPLYPCPVSLHSFNGFDIARKMKYRPRRKFRKVEKVQPKKNSIRKYIAKTAPGQTGKMVFQIKRAPVNCKLALTIALSLLGLAVMMVLKCSLKVLWSGVCFMGIACLLAGIFSNPEKASVPNKGRYLRRGKTFSRHLSICVAK